MYEIITNLSLYKKTTTKLIFPTKIVISKKCANCKNGFKFFSIKIIIFKNCANYKNR